MQATSATSVWVVSSTLASSRFLAQEWICASQFEIRGEIVVNRQTETFGLTEFKTIGSKHYQIAPTSLDLAMRQADEEFTELLQHKKFPLLDTHQNADPVQAVFTPKEICIMDDFGAVRCCTGNPCALQRSIGHSLGVFTGNVEIAGIARELRTILAHGGDGRKHTTRANAVTNDGDGGNHTADQLATAIFVGTVLHGERNFIRLAWKRLNRQELIAQGAFGGKDGIRHRYLQ